MAFITIEDLYGQIEIIAFENAFVSGQDSVIEENIVLVEGRLSIREDEPTKIVAKSIKDFESVENNRSLNDANKFMPKGMYINITKLDEVAKDKLRKAIRFYNKEKVNMPIFVQINEEIKSCGYIFLNSENAKIFEEIVGKKNIKYKR
jgi:DNA polymerase-3 subunit alpha